MRSFMLPLCAILALAALPLRAQDAPEGGKDERGKLKDLMAKLRNGEVLTPEEQAQMDQMKEGGKRLLGRVKDELEGKGPRGRGREEGGALKPALELLNVHERAQLAAQIAQFQAGKKEEALAAIAKFIEEEALQAERDPETAGVARLTLGHLQFEAGKAEDAMGTYRTVTGRMAPEALMALLEQLLREKEPDANAILESYRQMLAMQKTALDRCRLLKGFLHLLDGPSANRLVPEARAKLFEGAAGSVPREEALAHREALAKEPPFPGGGAGPEMRGPPPEFMGRGMGREFLRGPDGKGPPGGPMGGGPDRPRMGPDQPGGGPDGQGVQPKAKEDF
ncbi:MAG: hypothetical protein M5U26_02755 [Planctomycetota bacterium]|nr:hypothetical protein [Planctomycetota bacterium]